MNPVTFTLGEFIDAMEKNGLPQEFEHGLVGRDPEDNTVISACALGQGMINLGIYYNSTYYHIDILWNQFYNCVATLNDSLHTRLQDIVDMVRVEFAGQMDYKFTAYETFERAIGRVKVPS